MDWLYILVVVVLVVAVLLYLRTRRNAPGPPVGSDRSGGNYVQGREADRVTGMSQEDRDWEAASQQRDVDRRGQAGPG